MPQAPAKGKSLKEAKKEGWRWGEMKILGKTLYNSLTCHTLVTFYILPAQPQVTTLLLAIQSSSNSGLSKPKRLTIGKSL